MRIQVKGIPVRFELNVWMATGIGIGAVGALGGAAVWMGVLPRQDPLWGHVSLGLALLGMALYFIGRVVDLVGTLRKKP